MQREPEHARDWRPQILAFSNDPHRRKRLLTFASWIEGGSGIATAVKIIEGDGPKARKLARDAETELREDINQHSLDAFALAVAAPSLDTGIAVLLQAHGVGPVVNNTVLLNWMDPSSFHDREDELRYAERVRRVTSFGRNVIVLASDGQRWESIEAMSDDKRRIDVWWWGRDSSRLMLLLAYLMTRTGMWHDARIRVLSAVQNGETQ